MLSDLPKCHANQTILTVDYGDLHVAKSNPILSPYFSLTCQKQLIIHFFNRLFSLVFQEPYFCFLPKSLVTPSQSSLLISSPLLDLIMTEEARHIPCSSPRLTALVISFNIGALGTTVDTWLVDTPIKRSSQLLSQIPDLYI